MYGRTWIQNQIWQWLNGKKYFPFQWLGARSVCSWCCNGVSPCAVAVAWCVIKFKNIRKRTMLYIRFHARVEMKSVVIIVEFGYVRMWGCGNVSVYFTKTFLVLLISHSPIQIWNAKTVHDETDHGIAIVDIHNLIRFITGDKYHYAYVHIRMVAAYRIPFIGLNWIPSFSDRNFNLKIITKWIFCHMHQKPFYVSGFTVENIFANFFSVSREKKKVINMTGGHKTAIISDFILNSTFNYMTSKLTIHNAPRRKKLYQNIVSIPAICYHTISEFN